MNKRKSRESRYKERHKREGRKKEELKRERKGEDGVNKDTRVGKEGGRRENKRRKRMME